MSDAPELITWIKPNGLEIKVNGSKETTEYCKSLKWVRKEEVPSGPNLGDPEEPASEDAPKLEVVSEDAGEEEETSETSRRESRKQRRAQRQSGD